MVFYKPKVYSTFYENLFNNKKYSDLLLKFENSSTTIHAHKSILASSSDTFKDLILKDENVNEITLNEDDKTFSEFIKFLYTGCFDLKKEEATFSLFLLFNKYKVKNPKDYKLPALKILKGLIAYIEKDLDKKQSEFDDLVELINFKKVDVDDLKKIGKKTKWLQKNSKWLNVIVKKKDESDESGSDSDKSGSDSDESGSESESGSDSEEDGDGDSVPKFDKKEGDKNSFDISKGGKRIKYKSGSSWGGNFLLKSTSTYSFKVISSQSGYIMFGFAPKLGFNKTSSVHSTCGFYFYMCNGSKYSQSGASYGTGNGGIYGFSSGTIYSIKWDKKKGTIEYWKDKQYCGVYYTNIDKKIKLFPAISFNNQGDELEFVKNPKVKSKK